MNNKQKIFMISYTVLIIFSLSTLVTLLFDFVWWFIPLTIGVAFGIVGIVLGLLFLGAWIYGYLEKASDTQKHTEEPK